MKSISPVRPLSPLVSSVSFSLSRDRFPPYALLIEAGQQFVLREHGNAILEQSAHFITSDLEHLWHIPAQIKIGMVLAKVQNRQRIILPAWEETYNALKLFGDAW